MSESVTTEEAAALLDLSPDTVRRLADTGQLSSWRTPGGHRRITTASVREMLDNRETT